MNPEQPTTLERPTNRAGAPVFVTGATGYIGGRLVPRLLEAGYSVRCLARDRRKLAGRAWASDQRAEIVEGDVDHLDQLAASMRGCGCAYYLIHSMMAAGEAYRARDRQLAERFAEACRKAGVKRIIYLGGLGETGEGLSEHLASRREVEKALQSASVPVTVLRAAMIIGSGSASFEILRYLVERLPVMVTPKWVSTRCQPIAVRNVLHYLVACLSCPETTGKTLDIGGADVLTYRELMQQMAEAVGLRRRLIVPVPLLSPRLSSLWIHLVTPLSHKIARPLAEGLKNEVICQSDEASRLMPQALFTAREAIDLALGKLESDIVFSSWSDAGPIPGDPDWAGGKVFIDARELHIDASRDAVWSAVTSIGGRNGYYAGDWLWRLRGWMDRMVGGPGLRRGRRERRKLQFGDALDFWRVIRVETGRRLTLRAEMKLPGAAELDFEIQPDATGVTLVQTARFQPRGLLGIAYWYAVAPLHNIVFGGMMGGVRREAESSDHGRPQAAKQTAEQ